MEGMKRIVGFKTVPPHATLGTASIIREPGWLYESTHSDTSVWIMPLISPFNQPSLPSVGEGKGWLTGQLELHLIV